MQHARDRLRELTRRSRSPLPVNWIVEDMNRFLRGWAAYFRFGNSAARFQKIRNHALMRLALFISKRHRRRRGFGWSVVTYTGPWINWGWSPCRESSSTPGPSGTGGHRRMPAVNGVGEPCAGEPHARFEAAGAGNEADLAKGTGWRSRPGKPAEHEGPRPQTSTSHRASPDPTRLPVLCGHRHGSASAHWQRISRPIR